MAVDRVKAVKTVKAVERVKAAKSIKAVKRVKAVKTVKAVKRVKALNFLDTTLLDPPPYLWKAANGLPIITFETLGKYWLFSG